MRRGITLRPQSRGQRWETTPDAGQERVRYAVGQGTSTDMITCGNFPDPPTAEARR